MEGKTDIMLKVSLALRHSDVFFRCHSMSLISIRIISDIVQENTDT